MPSKKILHTGIAISAIAFLIGLFMLIPNADNLEYNTIFGKDKLKETERNLSYFGMSSPSEGFKIMRREGNIAAVGLIFMGSALIVLLGSYLLSNNRKMVENSNAQVALLSKMKDGELSENATDDFVAKKIRELAKLKDEGILTESEFSEKKKVLLAKYGNHHSETNADSNSFDDLPDL